MSRLTSRPRRSARPGPWTAGAAALALAGCGTAQVDDAGDAGGAADDSGATSAAAGLLTGQGMAIETEDAGVELCLGPVAESFPPQCQGIPLLGLDWSDVADRQTASSVTWGHVSVVGTYDGRTFTLSEPVAEPTFPVEPDGGTGASPFPQLCDDPYRGGEPPAEPGTPPVGAEAEALMAALEGYEGYVGSWVSDGFSVHNVLVTGDPDEAWAHLREVWSGGLCVEQRPDAATADLLREAQDALAAAEVDGLQGSSPSTDGRLQVAVLLADEATRQAVLDAVSGVLEPDQVELQPSLRPVEG